MKELKCSQAIAQENLQRYQSFWNESEQMPAILAYFGQAYKYLKAETFSKDDFAFAQDHLFSAPSYMAYSFIWLPRSLSTSLTGSE